MRVVSWKAAETRDDAYVRALEIVHNVSTLVSTTLSTFNGIQRRLLSVGRRRAEIESVSQCVPGAIERLLRVKAAYTRAHKHTRNSAFVSRESACFRSGSPHPPRPVPSRRARRPFDFPRRRHRLQIKMARYRAAQRDVVAAAPKERAGETGGGSSSSARPRGGGGGRRGGGDVEDMTHDVDQELLLEKEQEIGDLRETVEILEQKIGKLEQLIRLKDAKIEKLKEQVS